MSPASYQTAPPRVALARRLCVCASSLLPVYPSSLARAGNGTRTRDPNLGKVVLYQLSYSRAPQNLTAQWAGIYHPASALPVRPSDRWSTRPSGGEGDRTPDLVNAIHALSQLSYAPAIFAAPRPGNQPGRNTASYRDVLAVSSDFRAAA